MYMHYPNNPPWSFLVQRLVDEAVQDGADFNEMFRTLEHIPDKDFGAWYREWTRSGEKIEALAQEAAQKSRFVTARDAYIRAFTYYRAAQFWLESEDPMKNAAFSPAPYSFF